MDFEIERENNIIKNIANEIVYECSQKGIEASQGLASYVVKLKLLNPKHGFTAANVMPRSLTQQLVDMVVEDLKQDTPMMDCIRLQVEWKNSELNTNELKQEYFTQLSEKLEPLISEIEASEPDDLLKMQKLLIQYIITCQNFKTTNAQQHLRETTAAFHSIAKVKELTEFGSSKHEKKIELMKTFTRRVTGIRLYLKYTGKAAEGLEEVKDHLVKIENDKDEILDFMRDLSYKIDTLREVIINLIPMNFFRSDVAKTGEVNLPPECDISNLEYLKKILIIMLQHQMYLSDILSKMDEVDGAISELYMDYVATLEKLRHTIRDREAVPVMDVYDDFDKIGTIWENMQAYFYCFESVYGVAKKLEKTNQPKYFTPTLLEKLTVEKIFQMHPRSYSIKKSLDSTRSVRTLNALGLINSEDFLIEFNGFCAWTLYFTDGFLVAGNPDIGISQYQDKYYAFADTQRQALWLKNPQYYIMEIYEFLRKNPEMIDLLNVYEDLYQIRTLTLIQDVDRKIPTSTESIQTEVHAVPEYWDKDYTFSIWELKKRALTLSRLVKCVTKSVQTESPHSHFRASIGLLAAPDKDKEVQTKRDSSCVHSTISNYLYGLRGHREDKFRVVELTRPVKETYQRIMILGEEDPCRDRKRIPQIKEMSCASTQSDERCYKYEEYLGEYNGEI